MQTDPEGFGQDPGQQGGGGGTPPQESEADRLRKENANYREQLRQESAKRLAAEHGLSPTTAELLAQVPRDQQEAKAKALAEEFKAAAPAGEQAPIPEEGPDAAAAAAMQQMGTPPEPPEPAKTRDEQMRAEIEALDAGSPSQMRQSIEAIQQKYRELDRL